MKGLLEGKENAQEALRETPKEAGDAASMWEQLFQYHNFARSRSYPLEDLVQLINRSKDKQLVALSIR